MVLRMRELAVQMANGIYEDTPDRNNAQLEVTLINQITLIAENTRFNDVAVIDGSFTSVNIQAGNTTAETIELSFLDMASSGLNIDAVAVKRKPTLLLQSAHWTQHLRQSLQNKRRLVL